ncbi:uncharacterized protein LOC127795077 [Diospyros lotus]|uniref:uncharacterized protein LOC127795077 n=1 Tax=Diospyros lotus TaxID=55363 RepID=UPI002251F4B2|nr:uncharacterized protein LOC127795077 [Diospyros lotus]
MYGGSGKLGRGGGGGRGGAAAGKRNNPHSAFHHQPPPLHRPSAAPAGRLSVGGAAAAPRNRGAMTSRPGTSAPSGVEETFSLVTGNPLNFAMIIRLAPDLVDEIKRVEAQGGTARIKFDSNANNPSGNVIDVGGKDFRFTWSHEIRDLCDIYEERQSGEDGNGLLVESGCAWRKMNVQRILDESTKNHVKKRSEEAERQQKSRKAIILEHGNPTKSQIKALAAAEANPWRKPFMKKEPEFKKRKVETHTVTIGGPPKAAFKSGLPATTPAKGRPSVSPLPSPPEHSGAPASPLGTGNHTKGHTGIEEVMPIQVNTKENSTRSEKEMPNRATSGAARVKPGSRGNLGAKPTDLQSMLISLLKENPKGMSVKALEKAIGDKIPNSVKKIEPIIKKIATFQAPGRYFLKQGVELEHLKKPLSESGSSPEYDRHRTPAPENKQDDASAATRNFEEKVPTKEFDRQAGLNPKLGEQKSPEKVDTQNHSPDIFGDKKVSDNSEGPAGSSNDSGSDSDSESDSSDSGSDSGSHSRSRSKSRSPAGSGSASSSDSETDASSNSKQGPDEDVDIMTSDDDKELKPKSEPGVSVSPIPWRTSDSVPVQNGIDEKQDANSSDVVEIEKDSPDDVQQTETAVNLISNREGEKPLRDIRPFSPGNQECPENQVYTGILFGESESTAKDGFKHEQTGSSERLSRGKSKRSSDSMRHVEKLDHAKRLKSGSLPQPKAFRGRDSFFSESPQRLSPDRVIEDPYKGNSTQMMNKTSRDGNADSDIQKGYNQGSFGKSSLDSQNSGRRPVDVIARVRVPESAERHGIHAENLGYGHGVTERNRHFNDGLPIQKDNICSEIQDENCYTKEKNMPRNSKEGAFADTHSMYLDSTFYGKHGEPPGGKLKEAGEVSNSRMGYSLKDNERIDVERSSILNGRSKILQRELSDLELGELREPLLEETPGFKKEFERKSSFKQSENRTSSSDYWNLDTSKGKLTGKTSVDSRKLSPPHSRVGVPNNLEGLSKKTPEHHTEDINRLQHHRVGKSQSQALQHLSRVDRELDAYKLADMSGKPRQNEARVSQATGIEGYGDTNRKASSSAPQQYDTKRGPISHPMKESRTQKSNMLAELSDTRKDTSLTESNEGNVKRRESSSDENSCSYSKYEKEEPELKGPIKDINQYNEYVQEFCEKYDSYCSLNKILEGYRIEFEKLGKDLAIARERDMGKYYNIVNQLKESYRQCGTRHKRLKRIFVVLHEELKHMKEMMKDFATLYSSD